LVGSRLAAAAIAAVALGAGLWMATSTSPPGIDQARAAPPRPNVVVIETDDQAVESMRVMSNVNALIASRGTTFANSFVNYALCCPSRATFLTGQYAHNHQVLNNVPPNGGFGKFQALHGDNNLAVWLQRAGYYTGMIGKYLNLYSNSPPVPPGWSEWQAVAPDEQDVYDYTLNRQGNVSQIGTDPDEFKQDVLTRRAVSFVARRTQWVRPFFLWLTYTAPHGAGPDPSPNPPGNCGNTAKPAPRHANAFDSEPLPRPPNFNEADVSDKPEAIQRRRRLTATRVADIQRQYRCRLEALLSVDEGVKAVVDELRGRGELANTLLVFTSDNGFFHGEHRIPEGKTRIYEESIRVPLVIRGPGVPRGETVNGLVINADLAPTIVDAANATPGLVMDGRSLIPVAKNPTIVRGRQLLIEQPSFAAIRTGRFKYAEHDTGEKELYDLHSDPFELQSRDGAPAYAAAQAELARRLHELVACSGASCRANP
jgi:arylsulfatase A-like enzyme